MNWRAIFYQDWHPVAHVAISGAIAYVVLIAILRASGKRTLAKLNIFDFVVTVALGSTLSATLLNENISLAEGAVALALLVALQHVVISTAIHVPLIRRLVRAEPALLYAHGAFRRDAMRRERVTEREVRESVRKTGHGGMESVAFVVLETDGSFSVIASDHVGSADAMVEMDGL